jgi:hypothetical protein
MRPLITTARRHSSNVQDDPRFANLLLALQATTPIHMDKRVTVFLPSDDAFPEPPPSREEFKGVRLCCERIRRSHTRALPQFSLEYDVYPMKGTRAISSREGAAFSGSQ